MMRLARPFRSLIRVAAAAEGYPCARPRVVADFRLLGARSAAASHRERCVPARIEQHCCCSARLSKVGRIRSSFPTVCPVPFPPVLEASGASRLTQSSRTRALRRRKKRTAMTLPRFRRASKMQIHIVDSTQASVTTAWRTACSTHASVALTFSPLILSLLDLPARILSSRQTAQPPLTIHQPLSHKPSCPPTLVRPVSAGPRGPRARPQAAWHVHRHHEPEGAAPPRV